MKFIATISFLLLTTQLIAQGYKATPTQNAALKKQAEACADAMQKQNYKQMAYYTYPSIVKAVGGPDKMEQKITATMSQMQGMGIVFKSVSIGNIQDILKSQSDLYSIVQDILQVSNNGSIITASSYVLAYSHDNGVRWYFIDTTPMKNQNMKKLFPTFPPNLVIPQTHNPMMGN